MVPGAAAIARSLTGAARLARFDPDGFALFDDDARAFVDSFFAAALVAPAYVILVWLHLDRVEVAAGPAGVVAIEALGYVISWTAFPVAAHELARGMGRADRWIGFVVALNWCKVIQMAVYLPAALAARLMIADQGTATALSLAALTVIVTYQWFVTRTALDVHGVQAAGLTGFDVVLGFVITAATDSAIAA